MVEGFVVDFPSVVVREGKVEVLVPDLVAFGVMPSDYAPSRAPVFFNPVMEFNRDLSVLAFRVFQRLVNREISVCEPLTSQGIRGIRYAMEVEGVVRVLVSDINHHAFELAQYNILRNGVQDKVTLRLKEANALLSGNAAPMKRFDVVDIDPFGSPVSFLDSAFRAVKNKGLVAVTATDLAPLCGVHVKACVRKYGGKPLRVEYCHELAIRLLVGCMVQMAAKHDMGLNVLFSHSSDHYIRVYVQVSYGCQKADESLKSMGYVLHCFNCLHRETTHKPFNDLTCPDCCAKMDYAGPLWLGKINNAEFINQLLLESQIITLGTARKIDKMLAILKDEAEASITFYVLDQVGKKLCLPATSTQTVLTALQDMGYQAVPTHFNTRGIKTSAPAKVMRETFKKIVEPK
ncbi:MAG: tRNA (guanine(10)-N(2))-dimethyltransferase [Nitrososphaerota archaeon]|jgi:tRNA (guanine26-N2/guanine27-N2)-dimethyltransferase|nr:tRNA (guanine(10)-N(2))-dimethyltransferase [Nitrososphaerota archaeon]